MENTALLVGRLQTLRPRLLTKYRETYLKEQAAEWRATASELIGESNELANELREVYAAAVGKLVDVFTRSADFKKRRDALYSTRPDQMGDRLPDVELMARGLDGFTVTTPSLLEQTKLFDFTGRQLWPDPLQTNPNRFAVEMSQSVLAMAASGDPEQYSTLWWRAAQRRQAAYRVETERQDQRLREMERAQTERENRELKERFAAAHGLGVE